MPRKAAEGVIEMVSGGARARSGPPPDPTALARERPNDPSWIVLPVTGRPGDPPAWPLPAASDRELVHWRRLWAMPQATQWERLGLVVDVALYTRRLAEAELPGAGAALGNHVIRLSEALGLTTAGLRMNRWHIGSSAPAAAPVEPDPEPTGRVDPGPAGTSPRDRLKVVRGTRAG